MRLARQLADADPDATKEMLDQIAADLQEAVQELRNLAHGIYPPLLMDRGLPDALRAAGDRAALPTSVEAEDDRPLPAAGRGRDLLLLPRGAAERGQARGRGRRRSRSTLREEEGALLFEVADTGAGFDLASGARRRATAS